MATGRTLARWTRFYLNGYDLSGDTRSLGPLAHAQEVEEMEALSWSVKGGLPGHNMVSIGTVNAILSMDGVDEIHDLFNSPGSDYPVMIPMGIRAEPAAGDPAFIAQLNQLSYTLDVATNSMTVSIETGGKPTTTALNHKKPWGVLLHAKAAATAVNDSTGIDDNGASSSYGGVMCYQCFFSDGTATIKVQHADTNEDGSFADLTGATSGVVDFDSSSGAGIVQTATNLTVNRYLRWQIVLGTATTATFALAFVRSSAHNV